MTIRDAVRAAIATMPGNKPFRAGDMTIEDAEGKVQLGGNTYLSNEQVSRAIRDLPYVSRSNGLCRVKGRRVRRSR